MIRRRRIRANDRQPAPRPAAEEGPPAPRPDEPWEPPRLTLSPTAWAKLLYLRDLGPTEVGGFGIAAADDLLYVEDVQLVRQVCTGASVAFEDEAVADFFDRQVEEGRRPEQFARIWVHTHPGNSPQPSCVDEDTFARVFGRTEWAVMFVLARHGETYARLRFHVGPGGDLDLPIQVDFSRPFPASDFTAWKTEYATSVQADAELFDRRDPLLHLETLASLDAWDLDDWLFGREERRADGEQAFLHEREAQHAFG
jgi:hypothetical protein